MKNSATPEVRFGGFEQDWEEKTLGEIGNISTGNTPQTNKPKNYSKDGVLWVTPRDICSPVTKNSSRRLSQIGKTKAKIVPAGSVLVTCIASIGKNTLVLEESGFNQQINAIVPDSGFNSYFVLMLMDHITKKMLSVAGPGVRNIVNKRVFMSISTKTPSTAEQEKIGAFFKTLDATLEIAQKELSNLRQAKKGFLQKMFPKQHENKPEIRFEGFQDDWEETQLKDVVSRVIRKNEKLESKFPLTISAQNGLVAQSTFFKKRVASKDITKYYLVKNGEFAYNKSHSKGYPWGTVKRLDKYAQGVLSPLYIVFKPEKICSDFLVCYYDTNLWHKQISMCAVEGIRNHGLLNITAQNFFSTKLKIPSKFAEQEKIAAFFKNLDELIKIQQKQVSNLVQAKKGFLQKMFV